MAEPRVTSLIKRWKRLELDRGLWPTHWDDLSRVMLTRRLGFVTDTQPGDRRTDDLYDGTAMQSARGLANAMGGMLRPEGEPFFFIKTVEDEDEATDEAKDWLADTEERMREGMDDARARLRQAAGECDLDIVVLGTLVMFATEAVGNAQMLYQSVHLRDALPVFGEAGNVEGMFRSRVLTIRQAEAKWGVEKLSETTRKKFEAGKIDETIKVLFATVPREEGRADAMLSRNLPIAEIAIEVDAKHEIAVGGYHEFPYIVARWDTTSGEDYGRSPGMIALPDANSSQAIGETILIAGQRAADPPILAPSDAFLTAPHTYPGGIAAYEADAVRDLGSNPIRELTTGRNFPLTRDIQQDTREQIRNAFFRNVLNLPVPGDATMTATEVIARQQEFVREMGPVFGRLETDYTAPMVERTFNIMLRANAFLPVPEVLAGQQVRFEYESPIKRIREQSQALAAREWVRDKIEIATATGDPSALDVVNLDEYGRFTAEAANVPHDMVNGEDKIAATRQARAEAQAARDEEAALAQAAATAKDVGSTAKDIAQVA